MKGKQQLERVQCLHPDPSKQAPRIELWKYEAVKEVILAALVDQPGLNFKDLTQQVAARLKVDVGSVNWYTTVVKLDLEARGVVERLAGSGTQRLQIKQGQTKL
jgi:hypothetical protein